MCLDVVCKTPQQRIVWDFKILRIRPGLHCKASFRILSSSADGKDNDLCFIATLLHLGSANVEKDSSRELERVRRWKSNRKGKLLKLLNHSSLSTSSIKLMNSSQERLQIKLCISDIFWDQILRNVFSKAVHTHQVEGQPKKSKGPFEICLKWDWKKEIVVLVWKVEIGFSSCPVMEVFLSCSNYHRSSLENVNNIYILKDRLTLLYSRMNVLKFLSFWLQ